MTQYLAVGNATLDDIVTVDGEIRTHQIGGNGIYAAAGMNVWGGDVSLAIAIGTDFPAEHLSLIAESGIHLKQVERLNMPHVLRSRVFYLPDGSRTDRVHEARPFLPAHADEQMDLVTEYSDTGSPMHRAIWPLFTPTVRVDSGELLNDSYVHLSPGDLAVNRGNANKLKSAGAIISLDWPWWDWDTEGEADEELLRSIDFLLPSIEELTVHASARNLSPWDAANDLLSRGPKTIVVKMGSRGSRVLLRDGTTYDIPILPGNVVDPTGAGDSYCGGFMVGMADTGDPVQAALYGAVSASFIIEDFGLLHALEPRPQEAKRRLELLQQSYQFRA